MHLKRLRTSGDAWYAKAMALYEISFPPHEQRRAASQAAVMERGEYAFYLIFDGDTMVGILLCWEAARFIYVEHFCISPALRNRKYGQRALELLHRQGKPVILEIDPPVDEVSAHRKAFYERAGYCANDFEHIHPPYLRGRAGHRLVVMSRPARLTRAEYDVFYRYLCETVMRA